VPHPAGAAGPGGVARAPDLGQSSHVSPAWKARVLGLASTVLLAACGGGEVVPDLPPRADAAHALTVVPLPSEAVRGPGSFSVTPRTPVTYAPNAQSERVARYFVEVMQQTTGLSMAVSAAASSAPGAIRFEMTADKVGQSDEGYSLEIAPDGVAVSARSPQGLFYGAVTLWQLVPARVTQGQSLQIPSVTISDAPHLRWRGLMLDSARHYQSPEFIKRFIDLMALHKLNVLHWHLTDDQGWRI
jgi:hexosaminidase